MWHRHSCLCLCRRSRLEIVAAGFNRGFEVGPKLQAGSEKLTPRVPPGYGLTPASPTRARPASTENRQPITREALLLRHRDRRRRAGPCPVVVKRFDADVAVDGA